MSKTVKVSFNTTGEIKKEAETLFAELGLNMTTAINIFLKKAIQVQGIPFDVCLELPNGSTHDAIEEIKQLLANPNRKSYKSVEESLTALDEEE